MIAIRKQLFQIKTIVSLKLDARSKAVRSRCPKQQEALQANDGTRLPNASKGEVAGSALAEQEQEVENKKTHPMKPLGNHQVVPPRHEMYLFKQDIEAVKRVLACVCKEGNT